MQPIDVKHLGRERVICCWEIDGVLVDPGPESCLETLLEGLDGRRPEALLLTHIHFDHAGAAGALVEHFPGLPVFVHEKGARHLIDPSRLVSSASRLYGGEEGLARHWGRVVPVPEASVVALQGGETLLDRFDVLYTPGHASHHVCYRDRVSGRALVGDMAGVVIPPTHLTIAPTPPPDIDIAAWEASLDAIAAWDPSALCLTHFGLVEDAAAQLATVRQRLHQQADLQAANDLEGFEQELRKLLEQEADPATVAAFIQAAPPEHLYLGLQRWREKRAGR